jgi:hypothetical protein
LQTVPVGNSHPQIGSLVCAALNGNHPVLWRSNHVEDSPAILVRPLLSVGRELYRVILLAIPNEDFGMISPQVDIIEPISVNGDTLAHHLENAEIQMVMSGKLQEVIMSAEFKKVAIYANGLIFGIA